MRMKENKLIIIVLVKMFRMNMTFNARRHRKKIRDQHVWEYTGEYLLSPKKLLSLLQMIRLFVFSRNITFVMNLDIHYI